MSTRRYILHWCLITLCTLCAITIIIFSLLCLCAPKSMAQFSASLGMNKVETYFYTADYAKNGDINSLYKIVINNYNLGDYEKVEKYYEELESHEKYTEFVAYIDEENQKVETSALNKSALLNEDNYLKNRYITALIENGKLDKAFTYAVEHFKGYKNYTVDEQGTYLFYNLVALDNDSIFEKFKSNYVFENTLYRELVSYINQCISQFDNVFDQEEFNADIDSAKLLALNTRIKHVYTDIKLVAEATGYDVPEYLDNRVLAVNSLAIELL